MTKESILWLMENKDSWKFTQIEDSGGSLVGISFDFCGKMFKFQFEMSYLSIPACLKDVAQSVHGRLSRKLSHVGRTPISFQKTGTKGRTRYVTMENNGRER